MEVPLREVQYRRCVLFSVQSVHSGGHNTALRAAKGGGKEESGARFQHKCQKGENFDGGG